MLIRSLLYGTSCISRNTVIKRLTNTKTRSMILCGRKNYSNYEGEGQTVGFVINKRRSTALMLDAVGVNGFILTDGRELIGSIILFPHSLLAWHVLSPQDVNEESLTLFKILDPKIDILVFGYGASCQFPREMRQKFAEICRKLGIKFEALPTHQAAGLYNFLAEERRFVAAALIPPAIVDRLRFDRTKHLYLEEKLENEEIEGGEEPDAIESGKSNPKLIK